MLCLTFPNTCKSVSHSIPTHPIPLNCVAFWPIFSLARFQFVVFGFDVKADFFPFLSSSYFSIAIFASVSTFRIVVFVAFAAKELYLISSYVMCSTKQSSHSLVETVFLSAICQTKTGFV